jgi:predicted acetyltransferase
MVTRLMAPHDDVSFLPALESDLERLGDMLAHAFAFPKEEAKGWFERSGLENIRKLERGGRLCGGLVEIPMGQWFGGRSVSTMGVAGVGIASDERGRGVGSRLMVSMLREARARGFALSTLYPATVTLYRRVGYERAGARFSIAFDPRTCEIPREREMTIAEVSGTPEDVMALYRETARRSPGYMDRGRYTWERIEKPRGLLPTKTFTASHGGTLEGYVVLSHNPAENETTVTVTDIAATTSRAARALLRLLVEYRAQALLVKWFGGPSDLFTNLLPERHYEVKLTDHFMVRVVDVARALSERGWPRGASGALSLEVNDASMPENSGLYTLTLDGGTGTVVTAATAGTPRVAITERGLAALYSGHAPAHVLAAAGWLEADEDTQALLDAWFGGPLPTMRDFF